MKWLKLSFLLIILLIAGCNQNNKDIPTDNDEEVTDEIESTDSEVDSDPSNKVTE